MSKASQRRRKRQARLQQIVASGASVEDLIEQKDFASARDLLLLKETLSNSDRTLLAECYFGLKQYKDAANAVTLIPCESARDFHLVGFYLRYAKQWEEAEESLRKSLSLRPESTWTRILLVESLLKDARQFSEAHSEARTLLLECCAPGKSVPFAFLEFDRLADWETDSVEILSVLHSGIEQYPKEADIRCCLLRRLVCNLKDFNRAAELIGPLLMNESFSVEAIWLAFEIETGLKRHDQALRWIDHLIQYAADSKTQPLRFSLFQAKGEVLLELGEFDDAIQCFHVASQSKSHDDSLLALAGLALAALQQNDIGTTESALNRVISAWCERIECDDIPRIVGCLYRYDLIHRFEALQSLRSCLAANSSLDALVPFLEHIDYLLDRANAKPLPLKQLRKVARTLKHRVVDYDFSLTYGGQLRYLEATKHFLSFAKAANAVGSEARDAWIPHFFEQKLMPFSPSIPNSATEIHRAIVAFLNSDDRHKASKFIRTFVLPLYSRFWRTMLVQTKLWAELKAVSGFLIAVLPDRTDVLFDVALSTSELGDRQEAIKIYRDLLTKNPKDSSSWHNLSLLVEEDDCAEAIECARKALEAAPNDEYAIRRWKNVQDLEQRKAAAEAKRRDEEARKDAFLQTARERFPQLDFHKRRILSTLTVVTSFDSLDHLAELSGTGSGQYINGNWKKLVELGMIVEDEDGKPKVNKYVLDLVQLERSHAVATTLIRADDTIAFKPVFNSRLEYTIYNVMIGLFPNHLVFPNMALQSIFQYDRMKDLLDADIFRYFLMSQVDICITSTSSYLPIVAFEIDSHYHDEKSQQERDEKKNSIFRLGGVSLLRLRAFGQPNEAAMRNDIIRAVRELGEEVRQTSRKAEGKLQVNLEIDFERFGAGIAR